MQISPTPITLSVGVLRKPTLREISKITFDKFIFYELLLKMTPEYFYTTFIKDNGGQDYWDSLSEEEKDKLTLYDIITNDKELSKIYAEVLNFFFVETVIYKEGLFVLLNEELDDGSEDITPEKVRGIITDESLPEIFELIQQLCCIYDSKEDDKEIKFKNNLAKKLFEKMNKAEQNKKKSDGNLTIPNIISAVCNKHPSLNYTNIWDLTVFQLLDSFDRMRKNSMYDIDSTRVSVWGDEEKTFDVSLWYKNEYDKK